MPNESEPLLDAALEYALRGWPVFPVFEPTDDGLCTCNRSDCDSPAKHPRTKHAFKAATTDPPQIREWCNTGPGATVGFRSAAPPELTLLNVDPPTRWHAIPPPALP